MAYYKVFKDLIESVVTDMTALAALDAASGTTPPTYKYFPAHFIEILETLSEYTLAQKTKYPLVALPLDITEEFGDVGSNYAKVKFNLILATITEPTWKSDKRYIENFEPILYPMYGYWKQAMIQSGFFSGLTKVNKIPHKKTDRLFWGKTAAFGNTGNILGDHIDAIEISDIEVTIKPKVLDCLVA